MQMLVHDSKLKIHDMTLNIGAGGRRRTHSHTDIKKSARKINMHRLRFIIFFVAMVAAVFATVTFSSPIKKLKSDEKWYLIFIIDLKKHHTHELWTITDRFTDINFQQENILSLSLGLLMAPSSTHIHQPPPEQQPLLDKQIEI